MAGPLSRTTFPTCTYRSGPSGDTAVASYLLHVKTRSPKKQEVADEMFQESDVWFKRDGVWKVVHLHYSPAPKKK